MKIKLQSSIDWKKKKKMYLRKKKPILDSIPIIELQGTSRLLYTILVVAWYIYNKTLKEKVLGQFFLSLS